MTATEPMSQAMMAAGPPSVAQASAPKSQPEPMIDPSEASNRPKNPMLRVRPSPAVDVSDPVDTAVSVNARPLPLGRLWDAPGHRRLERRQGGGRAKLADTSIWLKHRRPERTATGLEGSRAERLGGQPTRS